MITTPTQAAVAEVATPDAPPSAERYWPPLQGDWIYEDYARLPDNGFRYEVIRGELYMSPAPRPRHQIAVTNLCAAIKDFTNVHHLGTVIVSPVDVILPNVADPIQPDLIFIVTERLEIISDTRIEAAPDFVVEVLSPRREARDRQLKFDVYAEAGIREYWIVDPTPAARAIEVYVLRGEAYALLGRFGPDDTVRSEVLPGFGVRTGDVCPP